MAHLSERKPIVPVRLATHLGISRSTLSEALKRLTQLGYVSKTTRATATGRTSGVLLTELGARAISETSVLEVERLQGVLSALTPSERRAVERGLELLARASREWSAKQPTTSTRE